MGWTPGISAGRLWPGDDITRNCKPGFEVHHSSRWTSTSFDFEGGCMNDQDVRRILRLAKIMHVVFIAASISYIDLLARMRRREIFPMMTSDDPIIPVLDGALAVLSLSALVGGIYFPRLRVRYDSQRPKQYKLFIPAITLRQTFFGALAIYGLFGGMLGAHLWLVALSIGVGLGALILTFPTKKRLQRMIADAHGPPG